MEETNQPVILENPISSQDNKYRITINDYDYAVDKLCRNLKTPNLESRQ